MPTAWGLGAVGTEDSRGRGPSIKGRPRKAGERAHTDCGTPSARVGAWLEKVHVATRKEY